jgi:hypothetical protein
LQYPSKKGSKGLRSELCRACAIAGHLADGLSLNELVALVIAHGLPSPEEREALLSAKLEATEDDTTEG